MREIVFKYLTRPVAITCDTDLIKVTICVTTHELH